MKLRSDFVTNSSSSSFIIARNNKCTLEELKNVLRKEREHVLSFIKDYYYDLDVLKEEIHEMCPANIKIGSYEDAIEPMIDYLAKEFYSYPASGTHFDSWTVMSEYFSNEDGDPFSYFIYGYGYVVNTENFKVK